MGVTSLWPILAPSARPTPLPTLNRKRLAVDASIWIYQFLKAVRDKEGNALRNSHVVGFFRRICKLLFFGIKPVFVFDGGAPVLKRQTILGRKKRREGRREDAVRTAGKLLAVQMKRRGEEEEEAREKNREREKAGLAPQVEEEEEAVTADNLVYVGELGMDAHERTENRKFRKTDAYHLPELTSGIEGMGQPNDPRIMSAEELENYAKQFNNGEDVNLYDFSKIDFNGEFFMSLPAGDRYNILNAARLRSRMRMGLGKEQLEEMFPDRMAFSKFQIERVRERNELTQRLMNLNGMNDNLAGVGNGGGRIAGERGREYVLVKNDGVEGGWALGVVSTEKGVGDRNKPIDVDALHKTSRNKVESDDEDDEFEDVPVEGLNRLPKATGRQNMTYDTFQANEIANRRQRMTASNPVALTKQVSVAEEDDGLFVGRASGEGPTNQLLDFDDEDEELNRALAMSMQQEGEEDIMGGSEDEHIQQAINLSLQKNHQHDSEPEEDLDFEDVPLPDFEQRAVPEQRPLGKSSGKMIAHVVNNRANAAVPKRKAANISSGSDDEMNLQAVLAKARKQKAPEIRRQPAPIVSNLKNPFDGPLPFEKLGSIFGKKKNTQPAKTVVSGEEDDDMAGGFDNALQDDQAPKPLPPWLAGGGDIRSDVEEQNKCDLELNAADRERALEEERQYMRRNGPIQIDSSDDESEVEVVERPLPKQVPVEIMGEVVEPPSPRQLPEEKMGDVAEDVRAEPPISKLPDNRQPSVESAAVEQVAELIPVDDKETEEVGWSESDYGDVTTKPKTRVESEGSQKAKSVSPELEDVQMDGSGTREQEHTSLSPVFENIDAPDQAAALPTLVPQETAELPISNLSERERAEIDAEFDDFSDPEDEELMGQLAIEAEEHARFASTLNHKSERENQESYEQELKALRNQQKKDRRDADEVSQTMITECQALLRLFGLPYITAPMEAEAQCAELVRLGLVDGVVTDDCDIFLFGGTRVYKNMFNSNKFVECYLAADIEKELSLSRGQLISIAHLLGSDYTEGLPGIGPVTALEIISEFPTATGLSELKEWWASVQHQPHLPAGLTGFRKKFLKSQRAKLFLPPGFPSAAVTEAYWKPDVDSTPEPFQWGVPDLDRLREFLMATIGWTSERTDEVLVPVVRDMNRREAEGTQSNITKYFDGAVGAGARGIGEGAGKGGSKRMGEAVRKLKEKKQGKGKLDRTFADQAAKWVQREQAGLNKGSDGYMARQAKGKGKRKAATAKTIVEEEEEDDDEDEDGENDNEEELGDDDDHSDEGGEHESVEPTAGTRSRGKPTRKRAKV